MGLLPRFLTRRTKSLSSPTSSRSSAEDPARMSSGSLSDSLSVTRKSYEQQPQNTSPSEKSNSEIQPASPEHLSTHFSRELAHDLATEDGDSPSRLSLPASPHQGEWLGTSPTNLHDNPQNSSKTRSLRSKHYQELEDAFRIIDVDGDGRISATELGSVLRLLGVSASEGEIQLMMQAVDMDGDGQIDLEEFVLHNSLPEEQPESSAARTAELRAAFHVFDIDKNDFISASELYQVLKGLGEPTTMEDCGRMIRGVDTDGDGQVNFDEFQRMMTGGWVPVN